LRYITKTNGNKQLHLYRSYENCSL
jgi:hypothetical protein